MVKPCEIIDPILDKGRSFALLGLRLVLAVTFYKTAMQKWSDIDAVAQWFGYMGIPLPSLNAYMAATTEIVGAVMLLVGVGVRYISVPLLFVLLIAIITVHGANGWAVIADGFQVSDAYVNGKQVEGTLVILQNGVELVVYYMLMLLTLVTTGAGTFSLDYFIQKKMKNS